MAFASLNRTRIAHVLIGFVLATSVATAAEPSKDPRNLLGMWQDYARPGEKMLTSDAFLIGTDLPYKPEAQDIAADHMELFTEGRSIASAHLTCRPTGLQGITASKSSILIMQTPDELVFVSQEDREVRHVYMNQTHPKKLRPTYSGHSIAQWQGNTLVIDTIGFNGKGQLDEVGNPHSDQLHLTERLTPSADGQLLKNELTIDDPVYYTKPFTVTRTWVRTPGARLYDYDCAQNPRSDDFESMSFTDDWFKPTCVRPVKNHVAGDKVICTPAKQSTPRQ